ncbi:Eco57I restriction-modification methylase domain-containing protein, partial [Campylobacter upsaliensis]|uniref:PBECR3 domain-containing polyvalent protein n=1 Tax=Campylobacter upsaliensis TaxID=28080 RepID=UPI00214A04B8
SISSTPFTKEDNLSLNSKQSITQKAKIENTQDFKPFNDSVKDDKQAFLQFIKIMQDTKNGDFYPSENLQNALEKSGKKANENALLLFIKEYENKDAKLVELLKNIQETRIANKALSLIKYFTKARMMQSAIKAVPSDILKKYVNIDASQRMEVLSSLYSDFSNIMKEIALKGKKIPDPAALSEKGGAYLFNRQYRKILNIYEKIQENEELLRLLAHKNDYKTTIEIIQESKAKGLSVKQTKEAIEENKKQTTKLFDEVLNNPLKSETKPKSEDIIFTDTKGKEHTLTKEVQEQWLETFNLKSLNEAYTPKHSDEIKEALGGKEIKLQLGSLKKLIAQGREQYIPQIKEVLDSPEAILKDSDNAFLFAKHLKDDDYFVNVSVDKGEYLVSISNGIKETNNIKNKLDSGAEVIYQSPNANSNLQTLLQTSRYSANKIDEDIITQNETEKTFFERYPNLEDYDKKIWSGIDWGHSLTEKDVMYRDMLYIHYPDVGTLNRKLIDVIKNVRPLIGFDEQNKIIDKYFKKYHKMDITNKLKEKIYRYVHKNEGSIDEIGEFILNTQKELVAYMKNIIPQETRLSYEKIIEERGLLTIYKEKIEKANSLFKEANVKEEIKQIIDNGVKKGRDMQILGEENFTPEVVEYIHKNKAKAAIDKLEKDEAENLGFKYSDDVRLTIDSEAIQHTLKRHGAESDLVKNSGQIPVEYKDIAEYRNIVKNANESLRARDNAGNDIIVSYKQINGYAVVVEQIRKKNNELSFKTMFKQNGDYKNSKSYKETSALNQTLSIGYEPSANSFSKTDNESIAQNAKEQSHFNDIIQENEGGNQNAKQNQGNEFERAKRTMQDDTGRVFFKNELDKEKAHDTRGATGGSDIHSAGDELTASQILQESDTKISKRGSAGASGRGHTTGEENEKSIRMEDSVRSGGFSADDTHLRQNNTRPDDNERFNEGKAFKSIRPLHEKTTRGTRGLDNRNLPQQILNKKWSEALEKRGILSPLQNAKIEAKKEQAAKYTFTESANEKLILEDNYKALEALLNLEKYSKSGEDLLKGWDREYKKALANFKGFGKATNALLKLKDEDKAKWDNMLKDLSKTLGVKINIADLVQRSKDAYYTPDKIIEKMVQLVDDFAKNANKDLKDLYKLEPSAGIGRFFNHLPTRNSYAVEKDRLSAKMSEWLYPGLRVDNSGYEKSYFKLENQFDLIIGNPPYANFKIGDKDFKENIHNYFMKKNVDNLRADGISLQIITHNFMDAKSSYTRDLIAKDAEFLGAVRLPNTTFKDASVTTDIIAFRKRNAKDKDFDTSWAKSVEIEKDVWVNQYFLDNPQNVLGKMEVVNSQFGRAIAVKNENFDLDSLNLSDFIKSDKAFKSEFEYSYSDALQKARDDIYNKNEGVSFFESARGGELRYDEKGGRFVVLDDNLKEHEFSVYERIAEAKPDWTESFIETKLNALKEMMPKIVKVKEALFRLKEAELNPNASDEK